MLKVQQPEVPSSNGKVLCARLGTSTVCLKVSHHYPSSLHCTEILISIRACIPITIITLTTELLLKTPHKISFLLQDTTNYSPHGINLIFPWAGGSGIQMINLIYWQMQDSAKKREKVKVFWRLFGLLLQLPVFCLSARTRDKGKHVR